MNDNLDALIVDGVQVTKNLERIRLYITLPHRVLSFIYFFIIYIVILFIMIYSNE